MSVPGCVFYFCFMFVRQKKNKSGVISIQVIDKSSGKYKLHKTIGSSNDLLEIEKFVAEACNYIKEIKKTERV